MPTSAPQKKIESNGFNLLPESIRDNCDAMLLEQTRKIRWRCAFTSGLISGCTFYSTLAGEIFGRKFPRGGIDARLLSAKFSDTGVELEFRVDKQPPGARSILIYDSGRPEGLAVAGLLDVIDAPAGIGFNAFLAYDGPVFSFAIDRPSNSATITPFHFPPLLYDGASEKLDRGQRRVFSDGIWWPSEMCR
jgi:hypothetical protein